MKKLMVLLIILTFSGSGYAMCTWTVLSCTPSGQLCYNKGTSSCRNHSCAAEQIPNGKVTIYDSENNIVSTGKYDMSKYMNDNCTESFTNA